MKLPKLSALLGAALSQMLVAVGGEKSLTAEQAASLEASEKKIGEMEDEITQLKADKDAQTTTIAGLNAKVTELTTQVTTLTTEKNTLVTEKKDLQTKLDAKATGQITTVISKEDKEAHQAADTGAPKTENKYATSVDAEAAQMKKDKEQLNFK